jgi:hypothetical protein
MILSINAEPVGVLQVGDLLPQPSRFLLVVLQVSNLSSFGNIHTDVQANGKGSSFRIHTRQA